MVCSTNPSDSTHHTANQLIPLYAFVGDYFMSYLKRKSGIKDTGSILPGHGGILDRVDSHLSATVIFTFLYISFQMIAL